MKIENQKDVYIKTIKDKTFLILLKLSTFFKIKTNGLILKINPIKISDDEFLNIMNFDSKEALLGRELPIFHFNPDNKKDILSEINKYPELIENCINDADKICNHIFNFLGSNDTILTEIDWNHDFKNNYRWNSNQYYLGTTDHLDYIRKGIKADIKIPWELSRFQHIVTLGKAFWYTNDEKYVEEFIQELESWMDNNPVKLGVNWTCSMDIAIRAVNWIWGYYFFSESDLLTDKLKIEFLKILFLHGRHIINNLEFGEVRGNHYLSNIAGLIYLGIFFQESQEAKGWLSKGISALIEEMDYQIYPDGMNAELSINYHRLVTEIFAATTVLCLKNDIELPKSYMDQLERMFGFILVYTKPDGSAPQIGDVDDGRFQIISNYYGWDRQDHRYLLSIGAELFGRNDFKPTNQEFDEETFWLISNLKKLNTRNYQNSDSISFENSGFYLMHHEDHYMIIDGSSPNPKYLQGHRHNSALSFELFAYDKSFIIDPGSYVYTSDKKMRNLFRSTQYHNVVRVDNEEQNTFNNDPFYMGTEAKTKILNWKVTDEKDFFEGEHYGYERLNDPVIHRRQIIFNKKKKFWIINDILYGNNKHLFELYYHLAPMNLKSYDLPYSFITTNTETNLAIIPLKTDNLNVKVFEGFISPSYGVKIKSPIIKYYKKEEIKTCFSTLLVPFKEKNSLNQILDEFID
jgi:hypothetical protein